jgi:hypothetical protein
MPPDAVLTSSQISMVKAKSNSYTLRLQNDIVFIHVAGSSPSRGRLGCEDLSKLWFFLPPLNSQGRLFRMLGSCARLRYTAEGHLHATAVLHHLSRSVCQGLAKPMPCRH